MPDTLYTIPFSHYCEAGRWALQASGSAFREVQALPGLHRLPFLFPAKDDSGDRVTPYVLPSNPTTLNATARPVLRSSWDILAAANRGGVPEDVKETLDAVVGPAERSLFYSFVLDDPCFDCLVAQVTIYAINEWVLVHSKHTIHGLVDDILSVSVDTTSPIAFSGGFLIAASSCNYNTCLHTAVVALLFTTIGVNYKRVVKNPPTAKSTNTKKSAQQAA